MCVLVTELGPTLCDPMVASQAPLSMGVLLARILEWVAMPFSRGSAWLRDPTRVSRTAGGCFTFWATRGDHSFYTDRQNCLTDKWQIFSSSRETQLMLQEDATYSFFITDLWLIWSHTCTSHKATGTRDVPHTDTQIHRPTSTQPDLHPPRNHPRHTATRTPTPPHTHHPSHTPAQPRSPPRLSPHCSVTSHTPGRGLLPVRCCFRTRRLAPKELHTRRNTTHSQPKA